MSDERVPTPRERRSPSAQFRCQVCKRFVVGTEYGVCPRCGLGPPNVLVGDGQLDPIAWREARRSSRRNVAGPAYWLSVALVALAIGFGAALLAVC